MAVGAWWEPRPAAKAKKKAAGAPAAPTMLVERDQVIAFALYTQQAGVLKLSAQLYPLYPDESKEVRLEFKRDDRWIEAAKTEVIFPGWSAHFRVEGWDGSKDVAYRVRHGEKAAFEGLVRRDPTDKDTIVVANMSCNSSRTTGARRSSTTCSARIRTSCSSPETRRIATPNTPPVGSSSACSSGT
jgi:hypothetical protein